MIAADTNGMPMGHFPSRIIYEIDREPQGRLRRIDVGIPGNVFFQNIILRSSTQLPLRDPLLQSNSGIQAEQDRAVELIVMLVLILPRSIPSNNRLISSILLI